MNGILLVDKPSDWTSSDVVVKLRGVLHERRIGHAGTLDPMATGLLTVFVGRATRAVEFAENHSKRYIAGLRLGCVTDTQDITGNILREEKAEITPEQLAEVLADFKGPQKQLPPMYSAVKVNGQRLYKLARSGREIERKARDIFISGIACTGRNGKDYIIDISCSKGTYIRTLCHDIGEKLGCGGCMSSLRRVEAGCYTIGNAYTLDEIIESAKAGETEKLLIPVDSLFSEYPALKVDSKSAEKIRCGNDTKTAVTDGIYRVYSEDGEFLMLGKTENGKLRTIKSFFEVKA